MSTADLAVPAGPEAPAAAARSRGAAAWLRFLRSELRLIFGRLRNLLLLAVLAVLPVVLGIVLKISGGGGNGGGPAFLNQVAGNGVFLALVALFVMLTLVLPLTMAVVAGDAIAGEAGRGTLRSLLTIPAGRTRLLAIKYTAVVIFALVASLVIAVVALITGALLFGAGPVTLLSGNTISLGAGLLRLLVVVLYVAAAMAALGAIGLAVSAFTEHSIGAMAAVLVIAVFSEIADSVQQISAVHPYLPTHWWLSFDGLLRSPVDWSGELHGLLSFGCYAVIFLAIAWARFTSADVTS